MPVSHIHSALATHAATLGDRALESAEGLTITYTVAACLSYEAAELASRRFQGAFNTMRTRDRNRLQRRRGEDIHNLDAITYSKYDALACLRNPLPNRSGWEVQLVRANLIDINVPVFDIATGKELREFNRDSVMEDALYGLLTQEDITAGHENRRMRNPLTKDQVKWLFDRDPNSRDFILNTYKIDIGA